MNDNQCYHMYFMIKYRVQFVAPSFQVKYESVNVVLVNAEQERLPMMSMGFYLIQFILQVYIIVGDS